MVLAHNQKSKIIYQKWVLVISPLAVFLLTTSLAFSQYFPSNNYPPNYFRNPLGIPMELSGNFGQLRSDHFHMGLDIRTNQKENYPVYAAAEGYISRIKVERLGYGRAIYIAHPNGYTTLYAHLNDFYDTLNNYIKDKQYKEEKWEQDFELKPNQFPITKGQFIAYSGNTGGSRGAHLHFEIRDRNGNIQNPLLFGLPLADKAAPIIHHLFVYDRNYSTYHNPPVQVDITGGKGLYTTKDSLLEVNSDKISFGISAEDLIGKSSFKMGLYQAEVWIDSVAVFAFRMNNFSYPNSRYINACIDYEERFNGDTYIQHLSKLPGNHLSIFSKSLGDGVIELKDTLPHHAAVILKDAAGNISSLSFLYRRKDTVPAARSTNADITKLQPNNNFDLEKEGIKVSFNEMAFYDTVPFKVNVLNAPQQTVSSVYNLCCTDIPVHTYYDVSIKLLQQVPDSLRSKVLMQLSSDKYADAAKGDWNGNWMQASFERLGTFQLVMDTIAPSIEFVNIPKSNDYSNENHLTIEVKDNLSAIKKFRAVLDGQWLMFSRKDNYYIYNFDGHCSLGTHQLLVTAEDESGNIAQQAFSFIKEKPKPQPKTNKKKHKALTKKKSTKKKRK